MFTCNSLHSYRHRNTQKASLSVDCSSGIPHSGNSRRKWALAWNSDRNICLLNSWNWTMSLCKVYLYSFYSLYSLCCLYPFYWLFLKNDWPIGFSLQLVIPTYFGFCSICTPQLVVVFLQHRPVVRQTRHCKPNHKRYVKLKLWKKSSCSNEGNWRILIQGRCDHLAE